MIIQDFKSRKITFLDKKIPLLFFRNGIIVSTYLEFWSFLIKDNDFMSEIYDNTKGLFDQYILPTYAPKTLFVRGQGTRLWDDEGREYLDFASGISVCNLGHCHERVTKAIQEQAAKLVHVSNIYLNDVTPRLAETLIKNGFDGAVFFCNSGAEANEGLIKLARKWGNPQGKNQIIVMDNSFHGRTLATLAATGRAKYRAGFEPDMGGFITVPFNDLEAVKQATTDKVCAVMLEPVQGEGGILPADVEFLKALREWCDQKNILLLFDEVQCGMGRLGTMYGYQSFGVEPDAFSMAKALANGFPMGAFVVKRAYAGVLTVGTHGSTFGGTPLAASAALAVQEAIVEENLLENCRIQGEFLKSELAKLVDKFSMVTGVRGMGLMLGIVLDQPAGALQGKLLDQGLVTLTAGETVLRLLPPLTVTRQEAEQALKIIAEALALLASENEETKA